MSLNSPDKMFYITQTMQNIFVFYNTFFRKKREKNCVFGKKVEKRDLENKNILKKRKRKNNQLKIK